MNEEFIVTNEELSSYQNKLQLLNLDILESKAQLQFAIEVAELATWDFDLLTNKIFVNERLKDWFGIEPEGEITVSKIVAVVAPEERETVLAAIRMATHHSIGTYDIEYKIINPLTGLSRYVRSKGKVQFDSLNQPVKISGTLQDVTEQKQREQYKDDFINVASHELKTPVTSLKVSLQILNRMKDAPVPEVLAKMISQSNKSLDKLTCLVKGLLDSNRISQGQLQLHKTSVIVDKLIAECINGICTVSRHEIVVQGEKQLCVFADEQQIEQVLNNLLSNAIKYAPDSKTIVVNIARQDSMVEISVRDYGNGIIPEKLEFLFQRYYRADYGGYQFSGLGLGLYICSEIIKKHCGQIGVKSEVGAGSTFWFTLPLDS